MKQTIVTMLENALKEFPERSYVNKKTDSGWISYNFREVFKKTKALAAWLQKEGLKPEDRVAILSEGSPEWVITEFAVILSRGISVPLSIKLLPEEVGFRINHSQALFIALSKNTLDKVLKIAGNIEKAIKFLYLDEDFEEIKERFLSSGIPEERVFPITRCMDEGRTLLRDENRETGLRRILESIQEEDIVTISYTSGTTGNPKGIMLTHKNYYSNCQDAVEAFQVPICGYSTLVILPCDHSFAHTVGLYAAIVRGITLYFVDARGGAMGILRNIPGNLLETSPVFLLTVPALSGNFMKKIISGVSEKGKFAEFIFNKGIEAGIKYYGDGYNKPPLITRLLALPWHRLAEALVFKKIRATFGKNIGFFVGGGALLDIKQQRFFNALGMPVYQGYGLTEASPVISSNTQFAQKHGTCGKLMASVECRIIREDGSTAAPGEKGEIIIRGPNVMKGYYKNPEATAEALKDGWLHTGDLGIMDKDGFLFVSGREKALLISSDGEKYSPEEIEEAIINCSSVVHQAMLYNDHCRYTSALIVLDPEGTKKFLSSLAEKYPERILQHLTDKIFSYKKDPYYSRRFPAAWCPITYYIIPEAFSEQNQLLNSAMKMVRYKIEERYRAEIAYLNTPEGSRPVNSENLKALGRYITT